jgi:hypothetical protein
LKSTPQCTFPAFPHPIHAACGVVFEGAVTICGGFSFFGIEKSCYRFNKGARAWVQVNHLKVCLHEQ